MIDKIIEIVRQAGELFHNRDFKVESKGTISNNVTSADIAVQEFLQEKLEPLVPGSIFIGEEGEEHDYTKGEYMWIIDPIDGTANFIRDLGLSAISVALIHHGRPEIAVVFHPYRNEMFYAEAGKGAFLNGEPIHVSDRDVEHSIFCTAMSLYSKDYAKPCLNILEKVYQRCDDFRRLGSAVIELVSLACGRVDLYFEIRLFPWDFAAAELIIREAGGYVGTIDYEQTVYHRPIPIICANTKENYDYLKSVVLKEVPTIPYRE